MAGFDMKCPHCNVSVEVQAGEKWRSDYPPDFDMECFSCGRLLHVVVHQVPEFETMVRRCQMCSAQLSDDEPHYCGPCHSRLIELSEFNKRNAEATNA